ncbi:hypothetical protein [Microcoleus sp.]|uniref:hypothetical protein n=1 Tax=Microcoleus sp. TaxID=44472 RepID=UPI00352496F5
MPKNLVALPIAAGHSNRQLTAKLVSAVWRLIENPNTLCSRPAMYSTAGRLGFWVFLENPKPGEHIMPQEFVPDDNKSEPPNDDSAASEQDILMLTIVGSPKAVRKTILTLYRLGFAEVNDWSQLQRTGNPKQVMSVLIRRQVSTDNTAPRQ